MFKPLTYHGDILVQMMRQTYNYTEIYYNYTYMNI